MVLAAALGERQELPLVLLCGDTALNFDFEYPYVHLEGKFRTSTHKLFYYLNKATLTYYCRLITFS